jgi:hypothetical protein
MNPNINKLMDYERVCMEKDNLLRKNNTKGYAIYEKLSKMYLLLILVTNVFMKMGRLKWKRLMRLSLRRLMLRM